MAVAETTNGADLQAPNAGSARDRNSSGTADSDHRHYAKELSPLVSADGLSPHVDTSSPIPAERCGDAAVADGDDAAREGLKQEMRDLEELLSKLNPMAEEFVPPSLVGIGTAYGAAAPPLVHGGGWFFVNGYGINNGGVVNGGGGRKKKNGYDQGSCRVNNRNGMAQREEMIRRTVYVSDIDHQVTEEQLATLFINCGQVVDCRMCGDPNSLLRFAFIEFTDEEGASAALSLSGTMLGYYPVRVLPSKTAIAPVNPTFLPRSNGEREMCARTVYCTNIDKKVSHAEIKLFFESICGEVYRLRLLGDDQHSARIAFVEFVMAESATAALNCSGVVLGSLPIRVSPSKTPVRGEPLKDSCASQGNRFTSVKSFIP